MKAAVALAMAILARHPARLDAARTAARTHDVPCEVLLAVGLVEQGLGGLAQRDDAAHVWPHPGDLAAQADAAAHAVARWRRYCGSAPGALQFYHRSSCTVVPCPRRVRHRHGRETYASLVHRVSVRLVEAGVSCQ